MRTRKNSTDENTASYDLSISDLMAALCGIFVLILIAVIYQLNQSQQEYATKNAKAAEYYTMQNELYLDLTNEFKEDLDVWNAEIDKETLTIRFKDSNVLFEPNKADLKPGFEKILSSFFPRLIQVLQNESYLDEIDEIRIEGHTARNRNQKDYEDYVSGMELSQERTMNVMLYCLETVPEYSNWVRKNIAAIGYSKSRPILSEETKEPEWEKSRRVEFRIKTKAEKVLEDIRDIGIDAEEESN